MPSAPESGSPRARDRNRLRIIDAARKLWIETPGASMDAVAQAAGVVRRTLYAHFATREELIVAVAAGSADFVHEFVAPDPESSPTVRLAAMVSRLWSGARQMGLLVAAAAEVDAVVVTESIERVNRAVAAVIAEGQATGEFGDHLPPELMAKMLESSAMVMHRAFLEGSWAGSDDAAAVAALISVGVSPAKAQRALQHRRYRPPD